MSCFGLCNGELQPCLSHSCCYKLIPFDLLHCAVNLQGSKGIASYRGPLADPLCFALQCKSTGNKMLMCPRKTETATFTQMSYTDVLCHTELSSWEDQLSFSLLLQESLQTSVKAVPDEPLHNLCAGSNLNRVLAAAQQTFLQTLRSSI